MALSNSNNLSNSTLKMDTDPSASNAMPISSSSNSNTKMNKIFSFKPDSKNNSSEILNSQSGSHLNISQTNSTSKNDEDSLTKYGVTTNKLDELDKIMNNLDLWGIDVFIIDQLTTHSPLVAVTYTIFQVRTFLSNF